MIERNIEKNNKLTTATTMTAGSFRNLKPSDKIAVTKQAC